MSSRSERVALLLAAAAGCSSWELLTPTGVAEFAGVSMVYGGASNAFVVPLDDGALVVDTKLEPFTDDLLAHLRARGPAPTHVAITHGHRDHLEGLPRVLAVAAPDVRVHAAAPLVAAWGTNAPARSRAVASGTPVRLETADAERIELFAFDHAHTGGDLAVWLADRSVLLAGDLFQCGYHPHAERDEGGSWAGLTQAIRTLAALRPMHVVGGHGTRCDTAALDRYLAYLEALPGPSSTDPGYREFWILGQRVSSFEQARRCARFEAASGPWSSGFTLAPCGEICVATAPTDCPAH